MDFIKLIQEERKRQRSLPGSEFDLTNGPNDWAAIASKYVTESAQCHGIKPLKSDFQDSMVKAAAIIVAALDHIEYMEKEGRLR